MLGTHRAQGYQAKRKRSRQNITENKAQNYGSSPGQVRIHPTGRYLNIFVRACMPYRAYTLPFAPLLWY
jgi:hypothetical protein